jgi:hypothetical protein
LVEFPASFMIRFLSLVEGSLLSEFMGGGFKFQGQRVNDGAVAHRLPGAWRS